MTKTFGSLVFTTAVKALQERYGSRGQYARIEKSRDETGGLGAQEREYLSERDTFYMASLGETGWPYVQHRGGAKGFLKVIDNHTLAFADFRGNRQYINTGNLMTDNRVALILVDYPRQLRLKVLGRVQIFEGEKAKDWLPKVQSPGYKAVIERVYVIEVAAFDWNCQQHIVPRFTIEEIKDVLQPIEIQMAQLETDNKQLREQLAAMDKRRD